MKRHALHSVARRSKVAVTLRVTSAPGECANSQQTVGDQRLITRSVMATFPRRGTSLTEVLAAILIMSVGVLAVMTLFPIAIIRSVQATQLTNATILSKRAEALVAMFDLTSDRYIPQPEEGRVTHAIIDPLGWNDYFDAYGTNNGRIPWLYGNRNGTSYGYLPPGLSYDQSLTEEQLDAKWPVFKRRYALVANPMSRNDFSKQDIRNQDELPDPSGNLPGVPLRRLSFGPQPQGLAWGNNNVNTPGYLGPTGPYPWFDTAAFSSGPAGSTQLRDEILAAVGLPDHFNEVFSGIPDNQTQPPVTAVSFDATTTDLSFMETHDGSVGNNPNATYKLVPGSRAILVDGTGRYSQVREVLPEGGGLGLRVYSDGTNWIIEWRQNDPVPFVISEVRVEIPQARYTWMLTVRKRGISGGSVSEIDCVTFFNRPLGDPEEELLHRTFVPVNNYPDVDPPYQVPLARNETGPRDLLTIFFSKPNNDTEDPPIKKGAWLFDPQNALWYQMIDIIHESDTTNSGDGSATVQLDRRAESPISWVTIPEGVINVFHLRSRVDQKRLEEARR